MNGRGCWGPSEQLASADTRLTLRCGSISHDTVRLWTILIQLLSSVSTNSCLSAFLVCTGELVGWLLTNPGKFLLLVREGAACGSLCVPTKPRSKYPFHPGGWQKFPGHKHLAQLQWSQVPELRRAMHFHRVYFSVWKSVSCSDCSLPGSCVHGILQTRILKWAAYPFSRGSSQPRDWTQVSCIAGRFFTIWATRKLFKVPAAMLGELGLSVRRSIASLRRSFQWWQGTLILQRSVSVPPPPADKQPFCTFVLLCNCNSLVITTVRTAQPHWRLGDWMPYRTPHSCFKGGLSTQSCRGITAEAGRNFYVQMILSRTTGNTSLFLSLEAVHPNQSHPCSHSFSSVKHAP